MNRTTCARAVAAVAILLVAGVARAGLETQAFGYEQWERAVRERGLDPRDVVYPFLVSDEMAAWAEEQIRPHATMSQEAKLLALQRAFFDSGEFSFAYDEQRTLTAEEAFASGHGNCMSFTSLFVAMSRSLGIPTFLLAVKREPEIEKEDDLVIVNRHVVVGFRMPTKVYYFDFYVTGSGPYINKTVVDDVVASAIYHTNHGGLAIREDDLEEALRHLEIAIALAPEWAPAWVNLGVAHSRLGDIDSALSAHQKALVVDPGNSSALTNMAHIFRDMGREDEARAALKAAADGSRNPFTLIAIADVEMMRGSLDQARRYLKRARWWDGKEPEVYDALARLARLEGDEAKAAKNSQKAAELRQRALENSDEFLN